MRKGKEEGDEEGTATAITAAPGTITAAAPLPGTAAIVAPERGLAAATEGAVPLLALQPRQALAELLFWTQIFKDHMVMYRDMLADEHAALKRRAYGLQTGWSALEQVLLMPETPGYTGVGQDPTDLRENASNSSKVFQRLLEQTRRYKVGVLDAIRIGVWPGFVFESFVRETIDEADYALELLVTGVDLETRVRFWNRHAGDHAALNAHLTDPAEFMRPDVARQWQFAAAFEALAQPHDTWARRACTSAALAADGCWREHAAQSAAQAAEFLGALLEAQQRARDLRGLPFSSVISPLLMDHTIREVMYGIAALKGEPSPAVAVYARLAQAESARPPTNGDRSAAVPPHSPSPYF